MATLGDRPSTLYFAYGSNLSLPQMANRCPQSEFVGFANLRGYRWHINSRGYANVLRSTGSTVPGLVFRINKKDEATLDRCEGVRSRLYDKRRHLIEVTPHPLYANKLTKIVGLMVGDKLRQYPPYSPAATNPADTSRYEDRVSLVYIAEEYPNDGVIKTEYITRMREAAQYAMYLGVPRRFVADVIAPHLGITVSISPKMASVRPSRSRSRPAVVNPSPRRAESIITPIPPSPPSPPRPPTPPRSRPLRRRRSPSPRRRSPSPAVQTTEMVTVRSNIGNSPIIVDAEPMHGPGRMRPINIATECCLEGCQHGGNGRICHLRRENRKPHEISGAVFHDEVLTFLLEQRIRHPATSSEQLTSCDESTHDLSCHAYNHESTTSNMSHQEEEMEHLYEQDSETETGDSRLVYSVVMQVPLLENEPSYTIEATTKSLSLANEIVLKQFRDKCARLRGWDAPSRFDTESSGLVEGSKTNQDGTVIGPLIKAQLAPLGKLQEGEVRCTVDDVGCLCFETALPNGGGDARVWVAVQELLDWE